MKNTNWYKILIYSLTVVLLLSGLVWADSIDGNLTLNRTQNVDQIRRLTIEGAQNNGTNPYASVKFKNYDKTNTTDYIGATIEAFSKNGLESGNLVFSTKDETPGLLTERMRIGKDGTVNVIGTLTSAEIDVTGTISSNDLAVAGVTTSNSLDVTGLITSSELTVAGKITAQEIEVTDVGDWPDYVFGDDYDLLPLLDLEAYINQNKHLPGMPSQVEIEEEGLNISGIVKIQMEKIEELTLYIIEHKKENDALKEESDKLKEQMSVIEKRLSALEATR
ncbi:MAG: hypothetical protein K9L30_08885 [Desulfobacterales bacterium]|nr:hypothetical protein [Desulfobacterales bacterium]